MSYKNLIKPNLRLLPLLALGLSLTLAGCGSGGKKGEGLLGEPAPPPPKTSSSSSSSGAYTGTSSSSSSSSSGAAIGTYPDPDTGTTVKVVVAAEPGEIPYGESKKISLTFTDDKGKAITPNVTVEANSNCLTTLKESTITAPSLSNNVLTFIYTNQGCGSDDWVRFTTGAADKIVQLGTVKMVTLEEEVASVQFLVATPAKIYIAGDGTPKESVLTFKVLGQGGKPLADQQIIFSDAAAGGAQLLTPSDTSDKEGIVEARVKSGTVPTTVSIKAFHEKSRVEGFSGGLEVKGSMPTLSKFSIGASKFNIRSFNRINDETTQIVARISDTSGSPVPDGTIVRFESHEGGTIDTCRTLAGTCTSDWIPGGQQPADGRVQVLAYVQGQEEFKDNNSNNVFDDGDTFTDLPEPFSDDNLNGQFDSGEFFVDTIKNGKRDLADGKWNGVNCKHSDTSKCAPVSELVTLSQQLTLYLSSSASEICELGDFAKTIWVKPKGTISVGGLYLSDGNDDALNPGHPCSKGNPLANGTKITFTPSSGTLKGDTGSTLIGANEIYPSGPLGVIYEAPTQAGVQFLTMKVEIPGVITSSRSWTVYVSDTPPDDSTNVPDSNTAGTFIDPTLNQKVWVDITAAAGAIAFEATREITLTFKDELAAAKTITSPITASSACAVSSRAQISAPVVANNTVKFTYTAKGCVGDDVVTFSAAGNSKTVSVGSYKLITAGESVGGINFVSASPSQIPIATGGPGSGSLATVTFKVVGQSGNGVPGENVKFSIVGGAGGLALVNVAAVSDLNGLVKTQVRSGTTPNNVTILATVESNGAKASSLGLAVASGLSAPGRFSISVSSFNPHAYNFDSGTTTAVTVSATVADVSGNPVLDGTLVNFTSPEGGLITPTCLTVNGRCTVGFQSTGVEPKDGRITIAATVKGIENFTDNNGNLLFDEGDGFDLLKDDIYEPFTDLNDDGIYQIGEQFVDSDLDGVRDSPDKKWNGLNCLHSTLCGEANKLVDIQDSTVVNLTGHSGPTICQGTVNNGVTDVSAALGSTINVAAGGVITLSRLYLSDGNPFAINSPLASPCATGNSLPGNSKITFTTVGGTLLSPKDPIGISPYERLPNGAISALFTAPTTPGVIVLSMKVELPPHAGASDPSSYTFSWVVNVQ
ncbi:MAG: hypothetical protein RL497_2850 [Pseudomonadota bacterium]